MNRDIIIDDGKIINVTDFKSKAENIIEELNNSVFSQLIEQEEPQSNKGKAKKFYKNQINPIITPMQVTAKLNRLLRIYRPFNLDEAQSISDKEYLDAFGYYCDIISHINQFLVYMPDKQTFCAFANITTNVYNDLLENQRYSQIFMSFEDSFIQSNFSASQAGIVDSKTTLAKLQTKDAGHNLVKNPEAIVQNNYIGIDRQRINEKLDQFESMVSKPKALNQSKK